MVLTTVETKRALTLPEQESELGADDENRTRTICLEGRGSTIELHPRAIGQRRQQYPISFQRAKSYGSSAMFYASFVTFENASSHVQKCLLWRSFSRLYRIG